MAENSNKQALIAQLAQARGEMTHAVRGLAWSLDYPRRFRASVRQNKTSWLAGAGLTGWLLAKLPARKKKVKVFIKHDQQKGVEKKIKEVTQVGLFFTLLRMAFNLTRPFIMKFVTEKLGDAAKTYVAERTARGENLFQGSRGAGGSTLRP